MGVDYYEIDSLAVDPAARHVAHQALRIACLDLHIRDVDRPRICWFSEATDLDQAYVARHGEHFSERLTADGPGVLAGRTIRGQNVIWVLASSDLKSLAESLGHEVAHIYIGKKRGGGWTPRERAYQEAVAESYGRRFLEEDHR